jgi:hypothetical protein
MGIFAVQFSMKRIFNLVGMAFPGTFAAALLLTGCVAPKDAEHHQTAPVYDTAEQIRAMLPCKARVIERAPCYVYLKTTDGHGIYLGSPGSEAVVGRFLGVLKEGQSYNFPDAFLKYQKTQQGNEP